MNTDNHVVVHQGYYVEICDNCAWLTQDGKVTVNYDDRGVWDEYADADLALARSLACNESVK